MGSPAGRGRVLAWALWDCGSTGLNAIVVTFVFSVYLTKTVGAGLPGPTTPASWLGRALTVAGVTVALLAPVTGVWVDVPRRRRRTLGALTATLVLLTSGMSLIRADPSYMLAGLGLLALTAACSDLASVPYNAMLRQLASPETSGRVSGFGWAAGYIGSVTLLLVVYAGFISGNGPTRGLLHIPAADGLNVRAGMLMAAAWMAVFALPVLIAPPPPADAVTPTESDVAGWGAPATGLLGAYRKLWSDVVAEWRRDRNVVYYLLASAVFRDGLSGVFTFGAVLGVTVYGISQADVLLFGVTASVVAAVGAVIGGLLDDHIGSKPIILGSLASMIFAGATLMTLSGAAAFWVCGLLLCLFIGPTQSSARTLLLRMTAHGKEGVAFGLYTMTGRAVIFLAPLMFSTFVDTFGTDRAGMGGLLVVLAAGFAAMLMVRVPAAARRR
jgi:MFS transporter, UMF1 family